MNAKRGSELKNNHAGIAGSNTDRSGVRSNSNALEGSGPGAEVASASTAGPVAEVATATARLDGTMPICGMVATGDAMLDIARVRVGVRK